MYSKLEDETPTLTFSNFIENKEYSSVRGILGTKEGDKLILKIDGVILSSQYDKDGKISTRVTSADLKHPFFSDKTKDTKFVYVFKKYVTKKNPDDEFAEVVWIIKDSCAGYKTPKQVKEDKIMTLNSGFELGKVSPAGDEDNKWLKVEIPGKKGFLDNLYDQIYDLVYENRVRFGIPNKTREDIAKMMPVKLWHPIKKDSTELDDTKSSSIYIPIKHYKPNDKYPNLNFAKFTVPGANTTLTVDQVVNNVITVNACISIDSVFFGSKMSLQMKIISGIVTDITSKDSKPHPQQDELDEYSKNTELVNKLTKQLESLNTSPSASSPPEDELLSEVMNSGPVSGSADLGIDELLNN